LDSSTATSSDPRLPVRIKPLPGGYAIHFANGMSPIYISAAQSPTLEEAKALAQASAADDGGMERLGPDSLGIARLLADDRGYLYVEEWQCLPVGRWIPGCYRVCDFIFHGWAAQSELADCGIPGRAWTQADQDRAFALSWRRRAGD